MFLYVNGHWQFFFCELPAHISLPFYFFLLLIETMYFKYLPARVKENICNVCFSIF